MAGNDADSGATPSSQVRALGSDQRLLTNHASGKSGAPLALDGFRDERPSALALRELMQFGLSPVLGAQVYLFQITVHIAVVQIGHRISFQSSAGDSMNKCSNILIKDGESSERMAIGRSRHSWPELSLSCHCPSWSIQWCHMWWIDRPKTRFP